MKKIYIYINTELRNVTEVEDDVTEFYDEDHKAKIKIDGKEILIDGWTYEITSQSKDEGVF